MTAPILYPVIYWQSAAIVISDSPKTVTLFVRQIAAATAVGGGCIELDCHEPHGVVYIADTLAAQSAGALLDAISASPRNAGTATRITVAAVDCDFVREGDVRDHAEAWLETAVATFRKRHGNTPDVIAIENLAALHPQGVLAPPADLVSIARTLRLTWPEQAIVCGLPASALRQDRAALHAILATFPVAVGIYEGGIHLKQHPTERPRLLCRVKPGWLPAAGGGSAVRCLKWDRRLTLEERKADALPSIRTTGEQMLRVAARSLRPEATQPGTKDIADLTDAEIAVLHESWLFAFSLRDEPDPRVVRELARRRDGGAES